MLELINKKGTFEQDSDIIKLMKMIIYHWKKIYKF